MSTPVIIDTDGNIDDWMAIALLIGAGANILGVTVTGTGMVHLTPGVKNMLNFLATCGQPDIPVAAGVSAPMSFSNVYPSSARALADNAFGITLATNSNGPQSSSAVEFLYQTLKAQGGGTTILAIGGLTNLGLLFSNAAYSDVTQYIREIVVMGGAINQPGNVNGFNPDYSNTVAEWNIFVDPLAASLTFQKGVPITLIPLDASVNVPLDLPTYANFITQASPTSIGPVLIDALKTQIDFIASGGFDFWDPLAAAYIINPGVVTTQTMNLSVNTVLNEESDTSGQTVQSSSGASVSVAMSGDAEAFWNVFINAINNVPSSAPRLAKSSQRVIPVKPRAAPARR